MQTSPTEIERLIEQLRQSASAGPPTPPPVSPLPLGSSHGTIAAMDNDLVDAKIAASEARIDTKFALLRGDLKDFATRTDVETAARSTRNNIWGAAITLLGVVIAILAFAANRFDAGVTAGGALAPYAANQQARDQEQDAKLDRILERLPVTKGAADNQR